MAELLFPLQFKRQYSGSLDPDMVFATSAAMTTYLSDPIRYAGQIVSCLQTSAVYVLNGSMTAWTALGSGSGSTNISSLTGATQGLIAVGTSAGSLSTDASITVYQNSTMNQLEIYTEQASDQSRYVVDHINLDSTGMGDAVAVTYIDATADSVGGQNRIGYMTDNGDDFYAGLSFTSASPNLEINRGVNITSGSYNISGVPHKHTVATISATGTPSSATYLRGDGVWATTSGSGGVTSHGALTGLSADDHTQYLTSARGDLRYSNISHKHGISSLSGTAYTGIAYGTSAGGLTTDAKINASINSGTYSIGISTYDVEQSVFIIDTTLVGGNQNYIYNVTDANTAAIQIGYTSGGNFVESQLAFSSASPNLQISTPINIPSGSYNISGVPHNHDGVYLTTGTSASFATSGHTHPQYALSASLSAYAPTASLSAYMPYSTSGSFSSSAHSHSLSALNGTLPVTMISATGSPSSITYLRGDGSWSTVSAGTTITTGNLSATTSVITISNGTSAVIGAGTGISISQATSSTNGYVTSSDWNTFNSKVSSASLSAYIPQSTSGMFASSAHSHYTYGLSDVSAVAPLDNQILVYSSVTGKYIPTNINDTSDYSNGSTGVVFFGGITLDTTTFSLGVIKAYFVDNTIPTSPIITYKEFPATSAIACDFLTSSITTFISIDVSGVIHQKTSPFTPTETRDWIPLGNIVHSNKSTINAVNNAPNVVLSPTNQLDDLMISIGVFNINGNIFGPNGTNMYINKSQGNIFKSGSNFSNDIKDPHTLGLSALSAPTNLRYRTQTGVETANTQSVIPDVYDLGGVPTAITGASWTVQRIYVFPSNLVRIQYGQTLYANKAAALEGINIDTFVVESAIVNNGLLRGLLIIDKSCTDLSDTNKATFIEVGKFGSTAGVSSVSTATLQSAYNNSVTPEIQTNSSLGALSVKIGATQTNTDIGFEVVNTSGTSTFMVNGNGYVSATDVTIPTMTMGVSAISSVKTAIQMLDKVNIDQQTPSGFVSRTTSDFVYNLAAKTVTLSATAGSYEFYNRGKYFVQSTSLSAAHTSAFGQYFFYLNNLGQFVVNPVNTAWDFADAQVTQIYYNGTSATAWWRGPEAVTFEERHGIMMDPETHREFHNTVGTYVPGYTGFALNGTYSVGTGNGGLVATTYGIDSGTIRDEDIPSSLSALTDTDGVGDIYPIFYKTGNANEWRWYVNNIPMLHNSATNNPYYNLNTGGTWSLAELSTNNRFYNIYIMAVPFKSASSSYNYRYIWVLGQAFYTSVANAQVESVLTIDLNGFPFVEVAPIWQITMEFITSNSTATGRTRIGATKKIVGTSLSVNVGGTATVHNNLAGRSDADAHPATAITYIPDSTLPILSATSITNVSLALSALDVSKQKNITAGSIPVSMISATGSATSATMLRGDGSWVSYLTERSGTFNTTTSGGYADIAFSPFFSGVPYVLQFEDDASPTNQYISMQYSNLFNGGFRVYWNAMPAIKTITWEAIG